MTQQEARQIVPMTFKIAGQDIAVILKDMGETFGEFDSVRNQIRIYLKVCAADNEYVAQTSQQLKNTFWHELMHAFSYFYNNETPEALAQVFGNFMCEFEESKKFNF